MLSRAALVSIVAMVVSVVAAHGQTNYYFDPGMDASGTGSGGSGTWDTDLTGDWYLPGAGDTVFPAYADPAGPGIANFDNAGGNVDVTTAVSPYQININVTDGTTEAIGTGTPDNTSTANQISINVGNGVNLNPLNINSQSAPGTENVVFNSNLNLNDTVQSYNGIDFNSYSSGNLEFNGGITFSNATTDPDDAGIPSVVLTGNVAGGSFTINSAFSAVNLPSATNPIHNPPVLRLNSANTMTLTSNASFVNTIVAANAGTILDQGASFSGNVGYAINVGGTGQYLTDVAGMDVTAGVVFSSGGGTIGGALAADTTYSAQEIVGYNGTNIDLTSAAGGRVNFTGDVHNGNGYEVVKVGAGTINMDDTGVNTRGEDQTGGFEIQNGTMLVSATNSLTGSGLTIDNVATSALVANTQTYATLGGTGSTGVHVTAAGANSAITPGDPEVKSAAGVFGIGTLTLNQGLTASSGVTFNINLDGTVTNGFSTVDFATSALTLAGPVTFNFTNLGGALDTNTPYDILTNFSPNTTGGSSLDTATYDLVAPAGYIATLDPTDLTPGATNFAVEFTQVAVPEPSTWALVGLGALVLIGTGKFRKLLA